MKNDFPSIPLNSAKIPEGNSHTKNIIKTAINILVVRSELPDDDDDDDVCNVGGFGIGCCCWIFEFWIDVDDEFRNLSLISCFFNCNWFGCIDTYDDVDGDDDDDDGVGDDDDDDDDDDDEDDEEQDLVDDVDVVVVNFLIIEFVQLRQIWQTFHKLFTSSVSFSFDFRCWRWWWWWFLLLLLLIGFVSWSILANFGCCFWLSLFSLLDWWISSVLFWFDCDLIDASAVATATVAVVGDERIWLFWFGILIDIVGLLLPLLWLIIDADDFDATGKFPFNKRSLRFLASINILINANVIHVNKPHGINFINTENTQNVIFSNSSWFFPSNFTISTWFTRKTVKKIIINKNFQQKITE